MKGSSSSSSSSSSCPSPNSMKIKTLIHSHFFRHVYQIVQALTKAKSIFMELISKNKDNNNYYLETIMKIKNKKRKKKKMKKKVFSSIRFHYNWCSSHVLPMPEPVLGDDGFDGGSSHVYYDSTWNSIVPPAEDDIDGFDSHLSGYLHWLDENKLPTEENNSCTSTNGDHGDIYEIDRLADKFIASFHEKFRLEKQESYRRYQEMLARSM